MSIRALCRGRRTRVFAAAGIALVLSLAAAACGGTETSEEGSGEIAADPTAAPTDIAADPTAAPTDIAADPTA
ncbi:MAG: hypothetical protein OXN95_01200, partial [bacterium]|nr:hypothetical protein [bacterium]